MKTLSTNKDKVIQVRVTQQEKERVEALASEIGITVSQLVSIILKSTALKIDSSLSFSGMINDANKRLREKSQQGKVLTK